MARLLRLPLLLTLAGLTIAFVLRANPAAAFTPHCNYGVGHYYQCDNIMGYSSSACGGPVYCTIGHMCYEWDCADDGEGNIVPGNPYTPGPQMCFCQPGYGYINCC